MNNFIKVDNYIIRASGISFVKKTYEKGKYRIAVFTETHSITFSYENHTERDRDFNRILKELNDVKNDVKLEKKEIRK